MPLLFIQQWIPAEVLHALGWTFLHSLWQGLLAAMLAAAVMIFTRKATARLRYHLLCAVLICFIAGAGSTFIYYWQQAPAATNITSPGVVSVSNNIYTGYETVITDEATFLEKVSIWFDANINLVVIIWALFFAMNCLKLFTGLASVRRLRHYRTIAAPAGWETTLQQLSASLGINQKVTLLQSALVKVPVALGVLRPVILVPIGLLMHLPPEQAETILLHELAHIKRKDYLVNLFQRFAEAIFFFNPALLWISSLIRMEREVCCDDVVLEHTAQRRNYLDALIAFQEYTAPSPSYALGIAGKRHHLLERVRRIITRENRKIGWPERVVLLAGILLLMAFTVITQKDTIKAESKQDTLVGINNENLNQWERPQSSQRQLRLPGLVSNDVQPVFASVKKTSIPVEKMRQLNLSSANHRYMSLSKLVYRDTPRVKSRVAEMLVQSGPTITEHSTHVRGDGSSKEVIRALGRDGNKYFFMKENGELKDMKVNGKLIDKRDYSQYAELIDHINQQLQKPGDRVPSKEEWDKMGKKAQDDWDKAGKKVKDDWDKMQDEVKKDMQKVDDDMKKLQKEFKEQNKQTEKNIQDKIEQAKREQGQRKDNEHKNRRTTHQPRVPQPRTYGKEPRANNDATKSKAPNTSLDIDMQQNDKKAFKYQEDKEISRELKSDVKIEAKEWEMENAFGHKSTLLVNKSDIRLFHNDKKIELGNIKVEGKFEVPVSPSAPGNKTAPVELKSPPSPNHKPVKIGGKSKPNIFKRTT
jgi:beta-lactamase regulating signal transducer with metallopeptidase domain